MLVASFLSVSVSELPFTLFLAAVQVETDDAPEEA
jgi:hypothetical protein